MRIFLPLVLVVSAITAGCAVEPFHKGDSKTGAQASATASKPGGTGAGPAVPAPEPEAAAPGSESAPEAEALPPPPPPRERPKVPAAKLSPASQALVNQAQAQRKKGDLPGATVSLDRALRIEPNNPLLWIEMGRLRMDQRNYPQAENMGRKALSMSVGDDRTQSAAWQLIADSYRARGKNAQAQEALEKSKLLSVR
jgi:tetratricopeptide (TPR) repeat protein